MLRSGAGLAGDADGSGGERPGSGGAGSGAPGGRGRIQPPTASTAGRASNAAGGAGVWAAPPTMPTFAAFSFRQQGGGPPAAVGAAADGSAPLLPPTSWAEVRVGASQEAPPAATSSGDMATSTGARQQVDGFGRSAAGAPTAAAMTRGQFGTNAPPLSRDNRVEDREVAPPIGRWLGAGAMAEAALRRPSKAGVVGPLAAAPTSSSPLAAFQAVPDADRNASAGAGRAGLSTAGQTTSLPSMFRKLSKEGAPGGDAALVSLRPSRQRQASPAQRRREALADAGADVGEDGNVGGRQINDLGMPAFQSPPPFYWVPDVDAITEFEVSGHFGEIVTKVGDYGDALCAPPIAGTLQMAKGGLYLWTLQIVRQSPSRPQLQFGLNGSAHANPRCLMSSARCARSRDDGPWVARPQGDLAIVEGDFVHCEADLRCLNGALGSLSFAINDGPLETAFEDIPISEGAVLHPVVCMGGDGTACRLCDF